MKKGTIDRIVEGETAVVLVEDENTQLHLSENQIPEEAWHSGAIIQFELESNEVTEVEHLADEEKERRKRIEDKYERLSEKLSDNSE